MECSKFFNLFSFSAKTKLDGDLAGLQKQIQLYSGESKPGVTERPAHAYMSAGMVGVFLIVKYYIIKGKFAGFFYKVLKL